jgi:ubiquinone/menaquinone biosynthesis C-methylase UbiE
MIENSTKRQAVPAAIEAENQRVRAAYARRRQLVPPTRYVRTDPFVLCSSHEREKQMAKLFRSDGLATLTGLRILDVGCGRGAMLRQLLDYGAEPELLAGIDLLEENVNGARALAPNLRIVCGSATHLPFPDSSFDLAVQFTLFTSVLADDVKYAIAADMKRVLAPGGRVLWYDFSVSNPKNRDVRGIGKREIGRLFEGFDFKATKITLAPPLGRMIAPISPMLYDLLSRVRPLCTHLMCLLKKPFDSNLGTNL